MVTAVKASNQTQYIFVIRNLFSVVLKQNLGTHGVSRLFGHPAKLSHVNTGEL
jgi:hypothetical protein